ncbi:tripartite-type tricarboxylate transporter receptor subunit TctC [Acidovorax sp. 69]|nr:tripartite tricarboxylate transporter substrate binding protein [Acidovorax sp. 69]PJI96136.1 tripartite-type tricarboxylate transporter receptor subunit TctC [Acidovorax sp. 69]
MKKIDTNTALRSQKMRRLCLAVLSCAAGVVGLAPIGFAQAQSYPTKPITLVVPFPPGGPTDQVARVLAQKLTEQMGQSVIVDNKPGANGNIGGTQVAKAAGDGYTLLYNTSSITLSPALYKNLSYDVQKDLAPVALTAVVPLALVVHPSIPANTVREFVEYAKANPGKLSYGSAGNGNVTHLAAFQFTKTLGIDATHVSYRGSAPADVDLVAGQIQFMTDTINSVMPFVKDKRLKLLAVTTAKRMSLYPDAPTLAETVMPGFEAGAWQGVMVPAKTPAALVQRLNAEINKALQSDDVRAKLAVQGAEPLGSTPEEYRTYVSLELQRWAGVVKSTGVTLD